MPQWDEQHDMKVWAPDDEDEPAEFDCIGYHRPSDLARDHATERYNKCDYPTEQNINVRNREGKLYEYVVETEMIPHFEVYEREPEAPAIEEQKP